MTTKRKPKKKLWLGRDVLFTRYQLGKSKSWDSSVFGFSERALIQVFCARQFESITGIRLKPGEVREVQSITIKLRPVEK